MTQRKEPTLTNLFGLFGSSETKAPRLETTGLVNEAVRAFTEAEENLNKVADQIHEQIQIDQRAIEELQYEQSVARDELSRIERIKERLSGLLK
ncbi:hypothetical protein PMW_206 [Pseudomonas phage phiPMW]|uniref:Uncharacterized protein n=1 Tax=Pseudomonas phage phiPMW TaxID=1815582 RepID=A0A1S5R1Q0_9CAUD|nr:hypothetical protein FDG97_gp144 [Pseudomonas phage phiPMW]ANA49331.1 hypothetical protein PMW_206 [Pseudomonas phage phiPMW]